MDFREFATKEASASLRRLHAGSADACRQQLASLCAAVDAAANALDAAAGPSAEAEADIAALVERLSRAAEAAAELAATRVADEARQIQDSLHADLDALLDQNKAVDAALKEAQAQSEALRTKLGDAYAQSERLQTELESAYAQSAALRGELEATQGQSTALRSELETALGQSTALRSELDTANAQSAALRRQVKEAHTQLETLGGEAVSAAKRADAMGKELEQTRDAAKKLETERRDLIKSRDSERLARTAVEGDLRKTAAQLEKTRNELAGLGGALETAVAAKTAAEDAAGVAHSQAQAADAKLAAVTELLKSHAARVKVLERAQQDHERTISDLKSRKQNAHGADTARASVSVFEDLLGAFEALAGATTISDVLTTMVEHMATGFSRVALFRVKSNHLQGEHQIGFDLKTDISKVVIPIGMDSVLTRAAGSGHIERLSADELAEGNGVPFSGKPSCAIAVPVVSGGETLAIVYADDLGASAAQRQSDAAPMLRLHFADAMRHHAESVIARMKTELRALSELRKYAASLLQEIEAMYVADAGAGTEGKDLQGRLKIHLDYARSIFANRAALEDADAGALLDDAIGAVVAEHADAGFRHDLAAAAGHSPAVGGKRAAEAS
jgi:chromosome segregation ATPase